MPTFRYETTAVVMFEVEASTEAEALLMARAAVPLLALEGLSFPTGDPDLAAATGVDRQSVLCFVDDIDENLELYERYNDTAPMPSRAELNGVDPGYDSPDGN